MTKSYQHQQDYVDERFARSYDVLAWSPRTGKTKTMIDTATKLYEQGSIECVLVICSVHAIEEWSNQIAEHSTTATDVYPLRLSRPMTKKVLKKWVKGKPKTLKYLIVNREAVLSKKVLEPLVDYIVNHRVGDEPQSRTLFIKDESHRLRTGGKRWECIRQIAANCKYRRLLSGTFITNTPEGVFYQCKLLMESPFGFNTVTKFRKHFEVPLPDTYKFGRSSGQWIKDRFVDAKKTIESEYGSIIRREDCTYLPTIQSTKHMFYLDDAEQDTYDRLFQEATTKTDMLPLHASAYADGYYPPAMAVLFHNKKLDRMLEIVEDTEDQVVIFTNFIMECDNVYKFFKEKGYPTLQITGGNDRMANQMSVESFQSGGARILVANVQCVQDSIGLHKASTVIWSSPNVDTTVRRQAIDRVSSVGKISVDEHHMIVAGTVQDDIHNTATNKSNISKTL